MCFVNHHLPQLVCSYPFRTPGHRHERNTREGKLLFESICRFKLVLKLMFAGVHEKATLALPLSGVSWLNAKLGTRGMVKASVVPITTQVTPNRIQTNKRRVSHSS